MKIYQRFPFDLKNPIGYTLALILQYIMLMCMLYSVACLLSIGFGAYVLIITVTEDIKINMTTIHTEETHLKIVGQFLDTIEIHSSAKQL